eukprot:2072008-Rhodomonas_salina.2
MTLLMRYARPLPRPCPRQTQPRTTIIIRSEPRTWRGCGGNVGAMMVTVMTVMRDAGRRQQEERMAHSTALSAMLLDLRTCPPAARCH